jgi:hypothetical protein
MKAGHELPITHETLRYLAGVDQGPVVSLFQPTFRTTFHKQQNRDRLKTLLARAEPLLAARGLDRKEIDRLLDAPRELGRDREFWRHRLSGLALYVARDLFRVYRVPFALPELVEVSEAPCIKPLLPALTTQGHFYVLAISRNLVRLVRGTRNRFFEQDLKSLGVPLSLSEALRYDDFSRQMQSHSTGRAEPRLQTHSQAEARAGRHMWHGHGLGDRQVKEEVGRFFGAVDEGVCKLLATEHAPLILAAVGYEQDLYRNLSHYPYITAEGIDGNPDRISPKDLQESAWPIARAALEAPAQAANVAYLEASSAGEASDDLGEILRATHEGRVSALLLQEGAEAWGHYDPDTAQTEIRVGRDPLDTDLLDLAARQTMLHGGDAYLVEPQEMPGHGPIAAVYRF